MPDPEPTVISPATTTPPSTTVTPPVIPPVEPPKSLVNEPPKTLVSEPVPLALTDIKMPDGLERDDDALGKFVGIMNNKDLSGAARAQALIDLQAEVIKAASEKSSATFTAMQEQWVTEAKADPEIGGAKLDENLANIARLIDSVGTPKLREVMDITGAGNHPEMIRFLTKVARLATEAKMLPAGLPGSEPRSQAARLYPTMKE